MMNTPALTDLRAAFNRNGFDLRFVGGCVRDMLNGTTPKDIDLCTDANPDQQIAVYEAENIRFIPTGIDHGTITVVMGDDVFEITSLRTESDHDGRWATVSYTNDWVLDLSRRDLTINAMALTFDGVLIDPFGGEDDLRNGIVRFVGSADDRMKEDYLRILRWFRFFGRFGHGSPDRDTANAIIRNAPGLAAISKERVWSEMNRIILDKNADVLLGLIADMGVADAIDLPMPNTARIRRLKRAAGFSKNPAVLMAAFLADDDLVSKIATSWKWSNTERDIARFVAARVLFPLDVREAKKLIAVNGVNRDWVVEQFKATGLGVSADVIANWDIPVFPVTGFDLIKNGVKPGPNMGKILNDLKTVWEQNNFQVDKDTLLKGV